MRAGPTITGALTLVGGLLLMRRRASAAEAPGALQFVPEGDGVGPGGTGGWLDWLPGLGEDDVQLSPEAIFYDPPPLSTFRRPDLIPVAEAAARRHGVPERGFVHQIWKESKFNPTICNGSSGACGIAQFMPPTAASFKIDPLNPEQSLDAAARYMAKLHKSFGSWALAAAAYNWGQGNLNKWKRGERTMPGETRDYVTVLAPAYNEPLPPGVEPLVLS